jgi:hypothetical protein
MLEMLLFGIYSDNNIPVGSKKENNNDDTNPTQQTSRKRKRSSSDARNKSIPDFPEPRLMSPFPDPEVGSRSSSHGNTD